jgi:hypothetical protein
VAKGEKTISTESFEAIDGLDTFIGNYLESVFGSRYDEQYQRIVALL